MLQALLSPTQNGCRILQRRQKGEWLIVFGFNKSPVEGSKVFRKAFSCRLSAAETFGGRGVTEDACGRFESGEECSAALRASFRWDENREATDHRGVMSVSRDHTRRRTSAAARGAASGAKNQDMKESRDKGVSAKEPQGRGGCCRNQNPEKRSRTKESSSMNRRRHRKMRISRSKQGKSLTCGPPYTGL